MVVKWILRLVWELCVTIEMYRNLIFIKIISLYLYLFIVTVLFILFFFSLHLHGHLERMKILIYLSNSYLSDDRLGNN